MSIFSHLRKSRQQAKEHNAKLAEQKKKDAQTTPYRHIPTHAASDAIASAPPAWREANDRPRIVEQNRRRSAMAAAGFSMNMPSTTTIPPMPRVSSSLSYVSYPNGEATPHVGMPRAYSSHSIHHPYGSNRDVVYSIPDAAMSQPSSWKGKEVSRNSLSVYDMSGGSSTAVSKDPTPEGSSRASNSSHDELEMVTVPTTRPKIAQTLQVPQTQPQQAAQLQSYHQLQQAQQTKQLQNLQQAQIQTVVQLPTSQPPQPVLGPEHPSVQAAPEPSSRPPSAGYAHRLHPSHRRTSSEHSDRTAVTTTTKPAAREPRAPPTSMRGFNYLATANQQQQQPVGKTAQPETNKDMRANNTQQQRPPVDYTGFAPRAPAMPAVAPPAARSSSDFNLGAFYIPSPGLDLSGGRQQPQQPPPQSQQQQADMEPIVSAKYARHGRSELPPPLAHESLVNIFPEPVPEPYNGRSGRGKLEKSKKTRWSFSKSSPISA